MSVRAKFKCVERFVEGFRLEAVIGGSPENDQFFKWTPSGTLHIGCVNPEVVAQFEVGKEYYIDITPAVAPVGSLPSDIQSALERLAEGNATRLSLMTEAYQQVLSKGKLTQDEVLVFKANGFDVVQAIYESTGMESDALLNQVELGEIPAQMVEQALLVTTAENANQAPPAAV